MNRIETPVLSKASDLDFSKLPRAAKLVLNLLKRLRVGQLHLQTPQAERYVFGVSNQSPAPNLIAHIHIHDWSFCQSLWKSGDIGFAQGYIDGLWSSPDVVSLLRLLIANRREMETAIYGHWPMRMLYRLKHWLHHNTRSNSRKNIHAHYDLGNAFYSLWLDPSMNYSSAWFGGVTPNLNQTAGSPLNPASATDSNPVESLQQAQWAKVRRALQMTAIQPGERLLEIGCGWGALMQLASQEFSAQVSGITLSTEQLHYAQQRLSEQGITAQLRLLDYRDLADEPYDAICSIEMIEAVGHQYWPVYFQTIHKQLKSTGRACIQSIVIDDALFERYMRSSDFIQQYIFPGGCLLSRQEFRSQAQAVGLEIIDEMAFGQDYAQTLAIWRERFLAQREQVLQLNFEPHFLRLWEFYLAYCEAAFTEKNIDVIQFTLRKP